MRTFFVPPDSLSGEETTLAGELFRHIAKVLRLRPGSPILLNDGAGRERTGRIGRIDRASLTVIFDPDAVALPATESGPPITIYQGLPKGEKMELILQKCTELGAAAIVPFVADRSIARPGAEKSADRLARWQRIAREAARQSRRSSVPDVELAGGIAEVLRAARQSVKLILWEEERTLRLRDVVAEHAVPDSVAILVGPEGGLTPDEVALAKEHGFIPVTLGTRIVRTETAGLAVLSILQYCWGDMG